MCCRVEGTPGVQKVLFGAGGRCQPGSLAHGVAGGLAKAQNTLQPLCNPANSGFNQKAVVSVLEQILHSVKVGNHNGKPGCRRLIGDQGKSLVAATGRRRRQSSRGRVEYRTACRQISPGCPADIWQPPAIARDQIRFTPTTISFTRRSLPQRLQQKRQSLALKLSQGHEQPTRSWSSMPRP